MATSSNDNATQHWIFFAPSERGHLTPMLPLFAEIPRLETPKQRITVIIQPWYDGIFESCVQLIEEAARELRSASSQDDTPVEVDIRVVNLYDITSWRWTGEAYPVMNIPTALGTADDVVHYLRHLDPPPSAIVFDPFEPVAIIAARVLNLPLITSVSYTPYSGKTIERWWKNTDLDEIQRKYDVSLHHENWIHLRLPFVLKSKTLPLMYTIPTALADLLPQESISKIIFAGSTTKYSKPKKNPQDDTITSIVSFVRHLKHDLHKKIIYFSLGTVIPQCFDEPSFKPVLTRLFEILFEIARQKSELEFIMSVANFPCEPTDPNTIFAQAPPNAHLYKWIPQVEIMPLVDAFFTHGGANSFNEALSLGIPMVVLPFAGDQPTNAGIAESLGCGLQIPYDEDTQYRSDQPERKSLNFDFVSATLDKVLAQEFKSKALQVQQCFDSHSYSITLESIRSWIEEKKYLE